MESQGTRKNRKFGVIHVLYVVIGLLLGLSGYFIFAINNTSPIDQYRSKVSFDLYYPEAIPKDYSLDKTSVSLQNDGLFFSIIKGNDAVQITQQKLPENVDSIKIDGFNTIATPIGTMLSGTTQNSASAIITTDKTLITLKASGSVSQEVLNSVAQSLEKTK